MPRFSLAASLVGWAAASFLTSLLVGLALATVDVSLALFAMAASYGAIFAGFLAGGYAAGRIGPDHGAIHGAALLAWTVLFTALGAGLSAWTRQPDFARMLSPFSIRWDALDPRAATGLGVVALVMLSGAALGAELGAMQASGRGIRFGKVKPARAS